MADDAAKTGVRQLPAWLKWPLAGLLAIIALISAAYFALNTPIGQRFITDRIASVAPASGLSIDIGRIEGDIYGKAKLHDVVLSDPKGEFLEFPLVELDWRPLSWIASGLDVRELVTHRGTLFRMPELNPGDPDAPILPDFDIRIDRFEIDDLTVASGLIDDRSHKINLEAKVDIRSGRALVRADGRLGDRDRVYALLDAEPDGDRFDIELDYRAPEDGVIAGLFGTKAGYRARIDGDGTWSDWKGGLLVTRGSERFAAFRLTNNAGRYGILGQAYPAEALQGTLANLVGEKVSLQARGTLESSTFDGDFAIRSIAIDARGEGAIDLAGNAFDDFSLSARLRDPDALSPSFALRGAFVEADLDGDFRDLVIDHRLSVAELAFGETQISALRQAGVARFEDERLIIPLDARIGRVLTGSDWIDPQLANGRLAGPLTLQGDQLSASALSLRFPGANARVSLAGNLSTGIYRIDGPVELAGVDFDNVGRVGGRADVALRIGGAAGWTLDADVNGQVSQVSNATIANLAGPELRFKGKAGIGSSRPIAFNDFSLQAQKLSLSLDGQIADGTTTLTGSGSHVDYGPFTVEAELADSGPEAVLVFADPLPAAGLADVRVALSPTEDGFAIDTSGGSLLGPFEGSLGLIAPAGGPTQLTIDRLSVWKTNVSGSLTIGDSGADGTLALAGGGVDGSIRLAPDGDAQGFVADIQADGARFAGPTPLTVARADIDLSGRFGEGRSELNGQAVAEGITYGSLFIGRVAANADLDNGRGKVLASISGRRGSRFRIDLDTDIAPDQIALAAQGAFAGRSIAMPRRAVFSSVEGGGWALARTQLNFADGRALLAGRFGTPKGTELEVKLDEMPISLIDIAVADLGLGGAASGVANYRIGPDRIPVGDALIKIDGLRRSGLVLTSQPLDLAVALDLTREQMRLRATMDEGGERRGRIQARISSLPASGDLAERLRSGSLRGQMVYDGPSGSLWRLLALDAFDLSGPIMITADARGTIDNPRIRGSLSGDDMRFESALTGTSLRNVTARGSFDGSTLTLSRLSGTTAGVGTVSGSGTVELNGLGEAVGSAIRGPGLDIKLAAKGAELVDANGLSATVTGPLRILSNGIGGTIAGRLRIERAGWRLGTAADSVEIPQIETREVNVPANVAPARAASPPWRFLIDARGSSRIDVDGLGLDSEWGADLLIRGTTSDPRIGGRAEVLRGTYSFAGTRFELTRGRIDFDENVPIDPRLDIEAETNQNGFAVTALVQGNALRPQISFTSNPALPEEEILSRLLFGSSITTLSATDALQLGAAVASLNGGGGMDPINQLRSAIGLDRLRIVGADPALDRGTGVALGKNFGRRFYVELVTDGRGYSATQLEFRVTSWISLLAAVSTIGRNSVAAEISKDY